MDNLGLAAQCVSFVIRRHKHDQPILDENAPVSLCGVAVQNTQQLRASGRLTARDVHQHQQPLAKLVDLIHVILNG